MELLGKMPRKLALTGKHSRTFFTKKGELKHIHNLKYWSLEEVLMDKYGQPKDVAVVVADFLTPMLDFNAARRATALDCLNHPWLSGDFKASTVGDDGASGGQAGEGSAEMKTEAEAVKGTERTAGGAAAEENGGAVGAESDAAVGVGESSSSAGDDRAGGTSGSS